MASTSKSTSKSNVPMYALTVIGLVIYAATTWVVVDNAGGVGTNSDDSNTPNGVVSGPPPFK